MLIAKIYVNERKIDEIHIQNIGQILQFNSKLHEYKIRKPEGCDDIKLAHIRARGYRLLLIMALTELEVRGIE